MIELGKFNNLKILRHTSVGLFLGDDEGQDVLLPNKYCPEKYEIDDVINVFVYKDFDERIIATNIIPKILFNEFALLEVVDTSGVGAFMDWGLEKDLMVPFREQRQKMLTGRWYVVYLDLDIETDRLYASNKTDNFLQNGILTVEVGDEVDLIITQKTDLGYNAIINHAHKGLIFENEIFRDLNIGEKIKGFVKNIREDNKIDLSLQAIGYDNFNDKNSEIVFNNLVERGGQLSITDKSSPEEIYAEFGMSKKAFKKAIGNLYKLKKIEIKGGLKLIQNS